MLAFYIDEKLTQSEESQVLDVLASMAKRLPHLEYRRIPCVFPAPNEQIGTEKMLEVVRGHVHNAGVPSGVQSIFIVPKDGIRWAVVLQEAFYLVTGFYPMMIQPWEIKLGDDQEADTVSRREHLRMIDMHSVMCG